MTSSTQQRAIRDYRARLAAQGLARFEVIGLGSDRELIRKLAKRLAASGPEAATLRSALGRTIGGEPRPHGGVLRALRGSPLVGAELDLDRPRGPGRELEL